jgi:hypothetical protein
VTSSSSAHELFARFDADVRCKKSFRAGSKISTRSILNSPCRQRVSNFRFGGLRPEEIMTVPTNNKHADYARFAFHCLTMDGPDQPSRDIQREMALEWLKLADAIVHSPDARASYILADN